MIIGTQKFWQDVLTERDGKTYELQRVFTVVGIVLIVAAFVWGCCLETAHFNRTDQFDLPAFLGAVSTFLFGAAAFAGGMYGTVHFKSKSETPPDDKKDAP